jgi:Putative restriction endonuclease
MVAKSIMSQPTTPNPTPLVWRMGYGPVRFTVDDALSMVEQGILPEDASVELLDGSLVYRDRFDLKGGEVVAGIQHDYVVTALAQLSRIIDNDRRHVRTQTTLVCSESHAPIPDFLILRGTLADYRGRLPTAADALCVVEVADSSYERDTGEKLAGYARAGVEQYVVRNLRNQTAEVRTDADAQVGDYPPPVIIAVNEILSLRVGGGESVSVALSDLLP